MKNIITTESIENKIFSLRGHRVMLDRDLAELYGVSTKALNQAVKRNKDRFPNDFMFQLTAQEIRPIWFSSRSQIVTLNRNGRAPNLRSQFVTSSWGGLRYIPRAFTEHGAVMLANVLKSDMAVRASIQVVRAFVHLQKSILNQEAIIRHLETPDRKVGKHDTELKAVLEILRKLIAPPLIPPTPKKPIGF